MPSIRILISLVLAVLLAPAASAQFGPHQRRPELGNLEDPVRPTVQDPVLSELAHEDVRISATDQVIFPSEQVNVVGQIRRQGVLGRKSLKGRPIQVASSPQADLDDAARELSDAAGQGDTAAMQDAANEIRAILLGETEGRIYDQFALLQYNQGAFVPGHVAGEYKTKTLVDNGLRTTGLDGAQRRIWEVTVNLLWYDDAFATDTHFVRVPFGAHPFDSVQVHYRIYSLVTENFSPTSFIHDYEFGMGGSLPYLGMDYAWILVHGDELTRLTIQHPPLAHLEEIVLWGRRGQPSRLASIRLLRELRNAHTGQIELDPASESLASRNRDRTLDSIGAAAPEMKLLEVADATLAGAPPATIEAALENAQTAPIGTADDWIRSMERHDELPIEAIAVLQGEGIPAGTYGSYDYVVAFANGEMYGSGPAGSTLPPLGQGQTLRLKVINLDDFPHYVQLWDYGQELDDDFLHCDTAPGGGNSLERFSWKPVHGTPKWHELQWRSAWSMRPGSGWIVQPKLFTRIEDGAAVQRLFGSDGLRLVGYQYSPAARGGDFRLEPPSDWMVEVREADESDGLVIGSETEGFGAARMCDGTHPLGQPCQDDLSAFHPRGKKNVDLDSDGTPDVLWFPAELRNPGAGGDVIPDNVRWGPFLYLSPQSGDLLVNPADPSQGYWVDRTYAHGRPVAAGDSLTFEIELPRATAQALEIRDGLFADGGRHRLVPEDRP